MEDMIVGRSPPTDSPHIIVDDNTVSRRHCRIRDFGDGRYEIVDLSSTGGTFVLGPKEWRPIEREIVSGSAELLLGEYRTIVNDLLRAVIRPKPKPVAVKGIVTFQRDPETGEIVRRSR